MKNGAANKRINTAFRLLAGGVAAAGFTAAALPSFVSTRMGLDAVLSVVNLWTPGRVEADALELGWSSGRRQSLRGLRLLDRRSPSAVLAEVAEMSFGGGLFQLGQAAGLVPLFGANSLGISALPPLIVRGCRVSCEFEPVEEEWKLLLWLQSTRSASLPAQITQAPGALPPSGIATSAAKPRAAGYVSRMLCKADSTMGLTADVRLGPHLQLLVTDSLLLVPKEVRSGIRSLHVDALIVRERRIKLRAHNVCTQRHGRPSSARQRRLWEPRCPGVV